MTAVTPDHEEELAALRETVAALEIRVEELQARRTEGFYAFESMAHLEAIVAERTRALEDARRSVERIVEERTRELRFKAEELARANHLLQELDQLKTNILQNVSHELKTPLVAIQGFAELMLRRQPGNLTPQQVEFLEVIVRNAVGLNKQIHTLLEAGSTTRTINPIDMTSFDLCDLFGRLFVDLAPEIERLGVTVSNELPSGGLPIVAYRHGVDMVARNLVGNALKFMAGRPTRELFLSIQRDGDAALIEVRDTGIGIPADKLPRIFERFFQVDASATRRYGGMGIGLALVREMVEGHEGTIFVESEVGVGTRFLVRLPLRPGSGLTAARPVQIPATPPDVVIVDDEQDSADYYAAAIRQIGHVPTLCLDPTEATRIIRPGVTRLALIDIAMPQMTGFQVLDELQRVHGADRLPPVLIITARSPGEIDEKQFPAFVKGVLYSPCAIDDIRAAIEAALAGR